MGSLQPAWVANHDPAVRIWSSPFKDAVDFCEAAEHWSVFTVLAAQVGRRVLVFNPVQPGHCRAGLDQRGRCGAGGSTVGAAPVPGGPPWGGVARRRS